jgi:hypothetical protein
MIIRFSKKLSEKLKEPDLPVIPPAENPYLDWHATLFRAQRNQYIMVSNSKSLFSIFLHGSGVTNFQKFFERFSDTLRNTLQDLGADLIYQRTIAPDTGSIRLAKAQDRRIIGSMNEQVFFAKTILYEEEISPFDLSFKVNEFILSAIKYATPKEAFWAMDEEMGKDATAEQKTLPVPKNKIKFNPAINQEKPAGIGHQLRLWKPEEKDFQDDLIVAPGENFGPKTGRNDPCPCGSGKKYKKCCGKNGVSNSESLSAMSGQAKAEHEKILSGPPDKTSGKCCFICGKTKKLIKTSCCDQWICDDEDQYVLFSYNQNSCMRNHRRYTLCGQHFESGHDGDWKTCSTCRGELSHELEMYVWFGTNEYNNEKLPAPPAFNPTFCAKCKKRILLPNGGYTVAAGKYYCDRCKPLVRF